jgi:hypothetical protein
MNKPYICDTCNSPYIIVGKYSSCPNGHGRLRPIQDGITKQAAERRAAVASLPRAVNLPRDTFGTGVYRIVDLPGLYTYSTVTTEIRAIYKGSVRYFFRAQGLENSLTKLFGVTFTEPYREEQ